MKKQKIHGQALIPVLIIMVIALILGVGVLNLSIGGLLLSSFSQEGERTLMAAEGALENGLLRVLRNPFYSGESLQVGGLSCTINTSGQAPMLMEADCDGGRTVRRLQAEVDFVDGEMMVSNLREIE